MGAAMASGSQRPFFSRSQKSSRLARFFLSMVLIVLPVGVYYFSVISEQSRQERERAARSLSETEQRIGNLLSAALGLQSVRGGGALNVEGLRASAIGAAACRKDAPAPTYLSLTASRRLSGGALTLCDPEGAVLEIDLSQPLREGRHLREFELLTLSTIEGELIAAHGGEPELLALAQSAQVGEQVSGVVTPLSVRHVLQLARAAARARGQLELGLDGGGLEGAEDAAREWAKAELAKGDGALESGLIQLRHAIGDARYQLTIKAYPLPVAMYREGSDTADSALVLIGFRQLGDWNLPESAIDPFGAWLLGAFFLGVVLMVPLVRLLLLEVHDSLTRHHARAVALCTVGLVGLITLTVLAGLAHQSLTGVMRAGAVEYAAELDLALRSEIQAVLQRINQHRHYYASREQPCAPQPDVGRHATAPATATMHPAGGLALCTDAASGSGAHAIYARILPPPGPGTGPAPPLRSPLSSTVLIERPDDRTGEARLGDMGLTYGPCASPLPSFNVGDREYHRMLAQGRAWRWDWSTADADTAAAMAWHAAADPWQTRSDAVGPACAEHLAGIGAIDRFVAQRLFNRRSGGKLMQFAVAMPGERFGAAVTGSAPMLPFTAAVPPLQYGFVVFDRTTGLVLLHDHDQRSLVENLYVETERSPELLAAVRAGAPSGFEGRYRGREHLFHYHPVRGTAWGLLVTYPSAALGSAVLHAALSTLLVGAVWLAAMAALYLVALRVTDRQTTWAWPQWRLREAYPYFALVLGLFLLLQILGYTAVGRAALIWVVILASVFVPCAAFALLSVQPTQRDPMRRLMLLAAVGSVLGVLMLALLRFKAESPVGFSAGLIEALALIATAVAVLVLLGRAWRRLSGLRPGTQDAYAAPPPFRLVEVRTSAGHARGYALCAALVLVILAVVPVGATFMHAYAWQVSAMMHAGLQRTLGALEHRQSAVEGWLRREVPDAGLRTAEYPDARTMSLDMAMPGLMTVREPATGASPASGAAPVCVAVRLFARPYCGQGTGDPAATRCQPRAVQGQQPAAYGQLELETACAAALSPAPQPPVFDAVHWVGRSLALASRQRALEGMLRAPQIPRVEPAAPPGWTAMQVHSLAPAGPEDRAAIVLQQRVLPLPRLGQRGTLRWGAVGWLALALLGIALPIYALVTLAMRRLTGLDRHAAQWADLLPSRSPRHAGLIRQLERNFGSAPRSLVTRLPPPTDRDSAALTPDVERALDGLADVLQGAAPERHVVLDRASPESSELPASGPVLFTGFDEAVAAGRESRQRTLQLLECAVRSVELQIYLLSDFRLARSLTQSIGFPAGDLDPDIDAAEANRWLMLYSRLRGWTLAEHIEPESLERRADRPELYESIDAECTILWPRLETLRRSLYLDVDAGRTWHTDQVEERVHAEAHSLMRRVWRLSTVAERLALYQLATRRIPNPRNEETLRVLVQRGLLRYRPGPRLVSRALERFTREAEPPSVFAEWQLDAADGTWQSLRGPIVLVLLLLFAGLSYSSGNTVAALVAGVTSSVGVIGALLNAFNLVRSGGGGTAKP